MNRIALSTYLSIINLSGLNALIKRKEREQNAQVTNIRNEKGSLKIL